MQSFIRKDGRTTSLGEVLSKVNQQSTNRIANWVLASAVIFLLASEEHARRTWRDRASDAQIGLARATLEISALRLAASQEKEAK